MLRFRNRFQGASSTLHTCGCGLRVTFSEAEGRQNIIHELPWCEKFAALMKQFQAEPGAQLHQAVVYDTERGIETLVTADGDAPKDVTEVPDLRSRGDA